MILTAWQIQNLQCYSDISKNKKEKLLPTESYIFLKCNYGIMHSNVFVIFCLSKRMAQKIKDAHSYRCTIQ